MTSDWAYLFNSLLDFVHPALNGVEAFLVCNVIDNNNTVSPVVVVAGDCFEALLAGRVPLLKIQSAIGRTFR